MGRIQITTQSKPQTARTSHTQTHTKNKTAEPGTRNTGAGDAEPIGRRADPDAKIRCQNSKRKTADNNNSNNNNNHK